MAQNKPILDYQPLSSTPRRRISIPAVLSYAAVLTSVAYLLLFQIAGDAPLRHVNNPPTGMKVWQDSLNITDTAIVNAANGQNIQLHLDVSEPDKPLNAKIFSMEYFSAVYRMYPQRVYVGNDNCIINDADGLYAADQLPSVTSMKQRRVSSIFTLSPSIHASR